AGLALSEESERRAESAAQVGRRGTLGGGRDAGEHPHRALPLAARRAHERTRTTPRLPRALDAVGALLEMLSPQGERFLEMLDRGVDARAEVGGDHRRHALHMLLHIEQCGANTGLFD